MTTFEYDTMNRVTKIIDANSSEAIFAYDVSGNITSITDAEGEYDLV